MNSWLVSFVSDKCGCNWRRKIYPQWISLVGSVQRTIVIWINCTLLCVWKKPFIQDGSQGKLRPLLEISCDHHAFLDYTLSLQASPSRCIDLIVCLNSQPCFIRCISRTTGFLLPDHWLCLSLAKEDVSGGSCPYYKMWLKYISLSHLPLVQGTLLSKWCQDTV